MLSGTRLLIVEEEFLIALDIQRVLEGANALQIVFARDFREVEKLLDRLAEFDLAIITAPRPETGDMAIAEKLLHAGLAIVVCSAARGAVANTALAAAEIVDKPFSDEALLEASRRALARRVKPA
jgi:DNA-binding NtrC family response regulator